MIRNILFNIRYIIITNDYIEEVNDGSSVSKYVSITAACYSRPPVSSTIRSGVGGFTTYNTAYTENIFYTYRYMTQVRVDSKMLLKLIKLNRPEFG